MTNQDRQSQRPTHERRSPEGQQSPARPDKSGSGHARKAGSTTGGGTDKRKPDNQIGDAQRTHKSADR